MNMLNNFAQHMWYRFAQNQYIPPIPQVNTDTSINKGLKIILAVAGAVAMLIIVIAGFRYTISQGDPQAVNKAKNTIIYAAIGLVICVTAFSIVTFAVKGL
jgi:uncharacterized membrane protein YidH (DUF202 family)